MNLLTDLKHKVGGKKENSHFIGIILTDINNINYLIHQHVENEIYGSGVQKGVQEIQQNRGWFMS